MYKVLIIDADPNELNTLSCIVDREDCALEIAGHLSDSRQVLRFLEENPVDILLLNPCLTPTDGITLLRKIRSRYLDVRCILCYDDLSYAQNAICLGVDSYLLKPVTPEALMEALLSATQKIKQAQALKLQQTKDMHLLRDSVLYRWLSGTIYDAELQYRLCTMDMQLCQTGYTVALIHTLNGHDRLNSQRRNAVLQICNQQLPPEWSIPAFYDLDENVIFLIPTDQLDSFLPTLESIITEVTAELERNVFAAVGSRETDYMQVHKSYETAKRIVSPFLVMPSHSVIFHSDTTVELLPASGQNGPPPLINQTFEKLMLNQEYKQCLAYVDNLFFDASMSAEITPTFLRNHIVKLVVHVLSLLRSYNIDATKVVGDESAVFNQIMNFHNMKDLYLWMKEFLTTAVGILETQNIRFSPCISRAVAHIEKNFSRDISLKTLAYELNINAAYLGQLFKAETGQLFSAFLNQTRIDNAKRLLLTTTLSLNDVSQQCGYTNVSYFYNIFKKYTGQTPSQYRKAKAK